MESFRNFYEIADFIGGNELVQAPDVIDAQDPAPFLVFLENLEQVRLFAESSHAPRILRAGKLEDETRWIINQTKTFKNSGVWSQRAVGQVKKTVAPVDCYLGWVTEPKKICFFIQAGLFQQGDCVRERKIPSFYG